jgi:hypothetical protein
VKVELMEMKAQTAPILPNHIHFFSDKNADMQQWYVKTFGVMAGRPTPGLHDGEHAGHRLELLAIADTDRRRHRAARSITSVSR